MTNFEIFSVACFWIGYGLFAAYQTDREGWEEEAVIALWCFYPLFAPIVFVSKCLYGAFKKYEDK